MYHFQKKEAEADTTADASILSTEQEVEPGEEEYGTPEPATPTKGQKKRKKKEKTPKEPKEIVR